ncbi:hypothetical protein [Gordonia sp. MP11Mi]|uniref:Uncharacterized protein n=1 Tax=Gordonia sp. MP11Mi TaxID=3022769 RepID=A0AA97CVA7_9ACTN
MSPSVAGRLGRPAGVRRLVLGLGVAYFAALGVYTVHSGIDVRFSTVSWIGMGLAFALFVAAAIPLGVTVSGELTDAHARGVALLTVGGVAATWGSAAYAHAPGLAAYQPMLATATMIAVILMFHGRVALVWAAIASIITIGLVLGPFTESARWLNVVLPRAGLTFLFVATCGAVLLGPQIAEMRALGARQRADYKDAQDRRHDVADREDRIRRIDDRVRPLLSRIAAGDPVTDDDIIDARLMEAKLRDGIRGRGLDVPRVRVAVWDARRRGVSVSVLDDGGLEPLGADRSAAVVEAVAAVLESELASLTSGDVVARIAPAGRDPVATVVVVSGPIRRRIELGADGFVVRTVEA